MDGRLWWTCVLGVWLLLAGEAGAARLALVMGNDSYRNVAPLRNARADARAMAKSLEESGFAVMLELDRTRSQMNAALKRFRQSVSGGDEVVVFYAGHGVQVGGSNYLLPVDMEDSTATEVSDDAVGLQRILEDLSERRPRFTLVIVDACRDDPFRAKGRNVGARGLVPTATATGQMVVYAAGAGQKALDRLGEADSSPNGVFTRVWLREMVKPGQSVEEVVKAVRREVARLARSVNHEQVPAMYDQSEGEFYFRKAEAGSLAKREEDAAAVEPSGAGTPLELGDLERWAGWQQRFEESYRKVERLGLGGGLAVEAWERLLKAHAEDNPYSQEDDRLRSEARRRLEQARLDVEKGKPRGKEAENPVRPPGEPVAGTVFREPGCEVCPEMVVVAGGEFEMGSPVEEAGRLKHEGPVRRVKVKSFALARTEVTRGEFRRFAQETGRNASNGEMCERPGFFRALAQTVRIFPAAKSWTESGFSQGDDHPVVCVNWDDAKAYAAWLSTKSGRNYRLATEAEWEYAARAGTKGAWPWGEEDSTACRHENGADRGAKMKYGVSWNAKGFLGAVFRCDDGYPETSPAGLFQASGFGLKDMLGNASEWVEDCWNESYGGAPLEGVAWLGGDCSRRVARGGAWSRGPSDMRAASRAAFSTSFRGSDLGFRLARTLP